MKNIFLLTISLLVISCSTPKKHFNRGDYESAVYSAVKKIRAKPSRAKKHGEILQRSYTIQMERWNGRIATLERENRAENALSIYNLYERIDRMQNEVRTINPFNIGGRSVTLAIVNVSQSMVYYKNEAATYLYNEANALLDNGMKADSRLAYNKLTDLIRLFPEYQNARALQAEAFESGQNHILVSANNMTDYILPTAFLQNLTYYNPDGLNSKWTQFHTAETKREYFDFFVDIVIKAAEISPEQFYEVRSLESRTVRDGWRYVLDERGQVLKDSLGNDVREPNYIEIFANVVAVEQTKAGIVLGEVVFSDSNGKLIRSWPFREELLFKNFFTNYSGDDRALNSETREQIGGGFVPFPSNLQMIMDASELIKNRSHRLIRNNAQLLE